jgi:hypothetical protein
MLIQETGWARDLAQVAELQANKKFLFSYHKLLSNGVAL